MPKEIKITAFFIFFFCLAASGMTFWASIGKIYTLDEAMLALRAHMINIAGLKGPAIALGNEGLTHPPLYEATLALLFRLFGETEITGRAFGIFGYIVSGIFLLALILRLCEAENCEFKKITAYFFLCFYLSSPLVLQHAMLIDAETGLNFIFCNIFVTVFVLSDSMTGRNFWFSRLFLGFLVALSFFAKEVTPFLMVISVLIYRFLNFEWRKGAADVLGILIFGIALIFAAKEAYTALSGEELHIFLQKQHGFRTARVLSVDFFMRVFKNLPMIIRWPVFWGTAAFHLLVMFCLGRRLWARFFKKEKSMTDYLWVSSLVIWVPYLLVKPSIDMMKFQHTAYPWFMICAAMEMSKIFKANLSYFSEWRKHLKAAGVFALIFTGSLTFYYFRAGDYILRLSTPAGVKLWRDFSFYYFLPIFLGLVLIFFLRKKGMRAVFFCLVFFGMSISTSFALCLHQRGAYTTVESWLNYGERGLRETVDYLASKDLKGKIVTARIDIFYYLKYRHQSEIESHLEPSSFFSLKNPQVIDRLFRSGALEYIVIDSVSKVYVPMKNTVVWKMLPGHYQVEKQFGDFLILKSRRT